MTAKVILGGASKERMRGGWRCDEGFLGKKRHSRWRTDWVQRPRCCPGSGPVRSAAKNRSPLMLLAEITHVQTVAQNGIGIGSAIAIVCSWHRNRSILLALVAGILSWVYVIYFALTRRPDESR